MNQWLQKLSSTDLSIQYRAYNLPIIGISTPLLSLTLASPLNVIFQVFLCCKLLLGGKKGCSKWSRGNRGLYIVGESLCTLRPNPGLFVSQPREMADHWLSINHYGLYPPRSSRCDITETCGSHHKISTRPASFPGNSWLSTKPSHWIACK